MKSIAIAQRFSVLVSSFFQKVIFRGMLSFVCFRMMLIFSFNSVILFHKNGIFQKGFGPAQFSFPIAPRSGKQAKTLTGHWVGPVPTVIPPRCPGIENW